MAQIKVYFDQSDNTITAWFGDPEDEYIVEETGDEVLLMKDADGKVIGFEKLNYTSALSSPLNIAFETMAI